MSASAPQALSDLRAVRELIGEEDHWGRYAWATTLDGTRTVEPASPEAGCWCLVGALRRVTGVRIRRYLDCLLALAGGLGKEATRDPELAESRLINWNDAPERTHAGVLAAIDETIARVEREGLGP